MSALIERATEYRIGSGPSALLYGGSKLRYALELGSRQIPKLFTNSGKNHRSPPNGGSHL
jgi:hypothetical protein